MVDYSKFRHLSPFLSFFFARLGASLGSFGDRCPQVGDFALGDSSLGLALGDLYPLLRQSLNWFRVVQGVFEEERMGSEVRSSDLETSLSSSGDTIRAKTDTPALVPSSSQPSVSQPPRAFHALKKECSLNEETLSRFRDRFQFPKETRIHLPRLSEKSCAFAHGEVYFYEAAFLCGLRFPVHPLIMEPLHYLNIAPGQLMPNSWRSS